MTPPPASRSEAAERSAPERRPRRPPRRRPGPTLLVAAAALLLWLVVTVPLALGERTLFFRDVFGNHLPLKAFGAAALARGEIPAFNPALGLGLPFRGNPSALAFYPDNLLYLVLPLWSAFNLHFALHWLLALVAMAALARELRMGRAAALAAGLTYAGSGFVLSCLSFYNTLTVAAWWPLAMAGAVRGGAGGVALGGAACGLALLGGEPLTAALGMLPLLVAAVGRHGSRRGLLHALGVGAVGLLVAAPQVVATARILGYTFRGSHGAALPQVAAFTLNPLRYLELVVPLPWGWPLDVGPQGWWLARSAPNVTYYLSLHFGVVALVLAAVAARRRAPWAALAVAGLAFAWLWGLEPELLAAVTFGVFRFPERFLFWFALAAPLLAGWGLDEALARPRGARRLATALGTVLTVLGLGFGAGRPLLARLAAGTAPAGSELAGRVERLVSFQAGAWSLSLLAGGALLLGVAWVVRRESLLSEHRAGLLAALQLVALLPLFPLVRTAPVEPFRQPPPWAGRVADERPANEGPGSDGGGREGPGRGAAVFYTLEPRPPWEAPVPHRQEVGNRAAAHRRNALDLAGTPGVLHGLTYPLWPDMEGLAPPLYTYLTVQLARAPWRARVPWLRAVGVEALVTHRPVPPHPDLALLDRAERHGQPSRLYAVRDPAPAAWWPRAVEASAGPEAALARVAALGDPVATVVAPRAVEHDPAGAVRLVAARAGRIELAVASRDGGLVVVRRNYHPLYHARAAGHGLETLPVNLVLTGVVVPPGEHRVVLAVGSGPERLAGGMALLTVAAALLLAWRQRRRGGRHDAAVGAP
ncbi:MAG TPA: hypothetical protein VHQ65_04070 [Thermoanaerobaculia bacterium]|nr:hypothetical protein [Thermoanaerobaculia bacterium]